MLTPALLDLVCDLYEETYGRVGAKVLRELLTRGRLTAGDLAHYTHLPLSAVHRTLVSLVTNRFVLFWQDKKTYYHGNWEQVYTILWTGEMLSHKSPEEREVVLRAIVEGIVPKSEVKTYTNYLRPVSEYEFWPMNELVGSLEQKARQNVARDAETLGKSETVKKQLVAASTRNELAKIQESSAVDADGLVPNWDRFLVSARRFELADFARRQVGVASGKLYEIVLKLSEKSVKNIREVRVPAPDTSVTTQQIVAKLPEGLLSELREAFSNSEEPVESSAKRVKLNSGAKHSVLASMSPAELVNAHLQLLSELRSARFVQRIGGRQQGEWFVPFDHVIKDLQQATLDEVVSQSLGEPASRLLRLIRDMGKLDEKMLGNQALLPALEIRHQMSALASLGFADIQELARPGDRGAAPGAQKRSIFLWYHRPKWAQDRLLDLLYTQLRAVLKEKRQLRFGHTTLLAKLTREDVSSDIDQFLTGKEKEELAEYRQAEHALYKRMNMIDRTVRIFREY